MVECTCPACGMKLRAPDELEGKGAKCPGCLNTFRIPPKQQAEALSTGLAQDSRSAELKAAAERSASGRSKTTKSCPYCGEEILLVARKCKHCGEFLDDSREPRPMPPPPKQGDSSEMTRWQGHPSWPAYLGCLGVGGILVVFGLGALAMMSSHPELTVTGVVFLCLGASSIIFTKLIIDNTVYTVTNKRVLVETGILSRHSTEIAIGDIRSIDMNQEIHNRVFEIGTVAVGSSSTDGLEVKFFGVSNPELLRNLIRKQKESFEAAAR